MTDIDELLRESTRCLLAVRGARGPLVSPMAAWYDGAGFWATTAASAVKAAVLRRDGGCSLYLPPLEEGAHGAVVRGTARVFGLHDPLGTAMHAPTISAAMTALAARNIGTILGYAQDAGRIPARWTARNRVVIRILAEAVAPVPSPEPGPGIAPALPPVVPPDIRRVCSGLRRVVVAADAGDHVLLAPAVWGAGFALQLPDGVALPDGARAQVVVDEDPRGRPTLVVGLAVHGVIADGALRPDRYTWWRGFDLETVPAPVGLPSVQLPD